ADVQRVVVVGNVLFKGTHDGVVLEQIGQRFVLEDVVDADHFNTRMVAQDAENAPADAPEAVDGNANVHFRPPSICVIRSIRSTTRGAEPQPLSYDGIVS